MFAVLPRQSDVGRDGAAELHDVGEVILVPGVVIATVGLEQVVACREISNKNFMTKNYIIGLF